MVKYECKRGNTQLEATGTADEIIADVALLVHLINEKFNTSDELPQDYAWHAIAYAMTNTLKKEGRNDD